MFKRLLVHRGAGYRERCHRGLGWAGLDSVAPDAGNNPVRNSFSAAAARGRLLSLSDRTTTRGSPRSPVSSRCSPRGGRLRKALESKKAARPRPGSDALRRGSFAAFSPRLFFRFERVCLRVSGDV
jgi:hypothetical protein